jgi:hypothetical protein
MDSLAWGSWTNRRSMFSHPTIPRQYHERHCDGRPLLAWHRFVKPTTQLTSLVGVNAAILSTMTASSRVTLVISAWLDWSLSSSNPTSPTFFRPISGVGPRIRCDDLWPSVHKQDHAIAMNQVATIRSANDLTRIRMVKQSIESMFTNTMKCEPARKAILRKWSC